MADWVKLGGCSAFIKTSYPAVKAANPELPILIREALGTPARAFARFGKLKVVGAIVDWLGGGLGLEGGEAVWTGWGWPSLGTTSQSNQLGSAQNNNQQKKPTRPISSKTRLSCNHRIAQTSTNHNPMTSQIDNVGAHSLASHAQSKPALARLRLRINPSRPDTII